VVVEAGIVVCVVYDCTSCISVCSIVVVELPLLEAMRVLLRGSGCSDEGWEREREDGEDEAEGGWGE